MPKEQKIFHRRPTRNGDSYYLNIPSTLVRKLGLTIDTKLEIKFTGQTILIRVVK